MNLQLQFFEESKDRDANINREKSYYPIGILGDIEIHFVHYNSEDEALEKWTRRKKRMNYDNLFVKISERDGCTRDTLRKYSRLNFDNKVSFSAHNYEELPNNVFFKENEELGIVDNELKIYKHYFDVVSWLNDGVIELR